MDAFIGEIRIFPYSFPPQGWLPCDGRQLSIQAYQALYSLLSTNFGGDGQNSFNLPNLAGFIPVGMGTATTGTVYQFAKTVGTQTVTLNGSQLPTHNHTMTGRVSTGTPTTTGMTAAPNTTAPLSKLSRAIVGGTPPKVSDTYSAPPHTGGSPTTSVGAQVSGYGGTTGGGVDAHPNMMLYLTMGYFICNEGVYPVNPN